MDDILSGGVITLALPRRGAQLCRHGHLSVVEGGSARYQDDPPSEAPWRVWASLQFDHTADTGLAGGRRLGTFGRRLAIHKILYSCQGERWTDDGMYRPYGIILLPCTAHVESSTSPPPTLLPARRDKAASQTLSPAAYGYADD